MNENNGNVTGVGFTGLLTIVFIVLKLTNVINWPWVWVLSPVWISCIVVFAVIVAVILIKLL